MSVASAKPGDAWRQWQRARHYGQRSPREFSLGEKLAYGAASAGARLCVRIWTATCRWQADAALRHEVLHGRTRAIFVLWHNRVPAFFAWMDSQARRDPQFRADSIISGSKDGEFLARPIRENGGVVIRGSSSRDATAALRGAMHSAHAGANICTVGDGPRGPRYRLKPGPVLLAKATGLPMIPVSWSGNRVAQLHRSWDQLMFPLPFSAIDIRFGEPLSVAADASARDIARARRELEQRLDALTRWADAATRIAWQIPRPKPGEVLKRRPQADPAGRHFDE